jgi:hypothetical protein
LLLARFYHAVMILFEREAGQLRYQAGDDDSGEDGNATSSSSCSRAASTWSGSPLLQPGLGGDRRDAVVSG